VRARYFLVAVILWIGAAGYPAGAGSDVADAAQRGDRAAVRALLQKKLDVNAAQIDGATALHWAIHRQDLELAELLIARGANVNAKTRESVTPLAMAAQYGQAALISRLLTAGADAKELGANGETMVMFAARAGSPDAIKVLVAAGADVNARERLRGTTALMWAAEQRHPDAIKALLELGADPSIRSGGAGVPRNYMAQRVNIRVVNEARERRIRAQAAGRTYEEQVTWEQENGVAMLGQRGLGTPLGPDGQPLQQAQPGRGRAQAGGRAGGRGAAPAAAPATAPGTAPAPARAADPDDDSEVVVAGLVGSGGGGLTPLIFAAREGDIASARALLDGGADVNQTSEYAWTPLLTAVNNRNYQLAALLLERGANPNLANKGGWTPLYLATDNRNIEGGDYPVPKPDMDHLEIIRRLLERGADANARIRENTLTRTIFTMQWFFEDGATAFVRASQSSDTALMQLLLKHGADPKAATANGDNALTASAGIGWVEGVTYERSAPENLEAMRMLLDLGLDPNHQNNEGRTALMGAAMKGRSDVVRLLVERGARLETTDYGSRDTDKLTSAAAGRRWQALDYADGLVRVGVQSAVARPETSAVIRKMMEDRGLPVPPADRNILSICVVALCQ
jgi:ankyrin repeat protein